MGGVFGLSTICIVMPFLQTASDRTKYSLQPGKLCVGTVKSIRYSGVCFHIFYCNSALSYVVRYNGVIVIAGFVFTYFTVILPGFHMLFVITGSSL